MKSKEQRKARRKGLFKEFVEFINKGNALALAIGVIIGGAFNAIVTAINKNIISPIIAAIIGDTNLSESIITVLKSHPATAEDVAAGLATTEGAIVNDIVISWGAFLQAVIDFLLIAVILFVIVKITTAFVNRAKAIKEKLLENEEEKVEEEIKEEIPTPVVVEEPADIKLLTEIRDLLKDKE